MLALDCLLIEAIAGYERGSHTRVGQTGDAFETFLLKPPFRRDFEIDDRAKSFARAVRHGILHDGETRHGWIVWKTSPTGRLVAPLRDGRLRIYRDAFHARVKEYVAGYFARLLEDREQELRVHFISRMKELCDESAPP